MELLKLVSELLVSVHSGKLIHSQVRVAADPIDRN
jgi:hypothetical protein